MKKNSKRIFKAKKQIPIKYVQNNSLASKLAKEDEEVFMNDRLLSAFVRDYEPGEFPDEFLSKEEEKNIRYTLVKLSDQAVAGHRF